MTANQYRVAIARVGLSQRKAGPWLGYTDRTSRRFANGALPVPLAVARLLKVMAKHGMTWRDVDKLDD